MSTDKTPIDPQKSSAGELSNAQFLGFLSILLTLPLIVPGFFRWLYFSAFPPSSGESAPTWFETSGQFGDMFGMTTCVVALIAAYFTRQTYLTQKKELQDERKRNEDANKERYFFKLHDDFKESLIKSRERDKESPNAFENDQTKGIARAVTDATKHAQECLLAAEAACNDKTERLQHFVTGFSARNFLGHYEFSLTFRKFLVAYSYLSNIMNVSPSGAYTLHHEILMSTMSENEMKLIALFWINYNFNKRDPKPFEEVFVFISTYCFDILGKFGLLKDQMLAVSILTNADPIIDEISDLRLLCGMGNE